MYDELESQSVKRFACTSCGKCCNRSPELELTEAAPLADVFVFRLMFRLYWLPDQLKDFDARGNRGPNSKTSFYERKRLLSAFAARTWPVKAKQFGKPVRFTKYLSISALALDTRPFACSALNGTRCGIYARRPISCRSVPLHYSRAQATAAADLEAFVATPGYHCDTSENAAIVLEDDRIVDPEMNRARRDSLAVAEAGRPWAEAIARRLGAGPHHHPDLPILNEIEENSTFAATTVSMRVAWQVAADAGLITREACGRLVAVQLDAITRSLNDETSSPAARETLMEMQFEYAHCLRSLRSQNNEPFEL